MTHLSGGAVSGIVFGSLLLFLCSISLLLWWRRVHRDLYSNDPNVWGGSWGVKAQRELQARIEQLKDMESISRVYSYTQMATNDLRRLEEKVHEMYLEYIGGTGGGDDHKVEVPVSRLLPFDIAQQLLFVLSPRIL